jgi:hypothetical protein
MGRTRAAALVAAGVLLNNYVYLHDLVLGKHDGFIWVGARSVAGIAVALALVGVGLFVLARAPER